MKTDRTDLSVDINLFRNIYQPKYNLTYSNITLVTGDRGRIGEASEMDNISSRSTLDVTND